MCQGRRTIRIFAHSLGGNIPHVSMGHALGIAYRATSGDTLGRTCPTPWKAYSPHAGERRALENVPHAFGPLSRKSIRLPSHAPWNTCHTPSCQKVKKTYHAKPRLQVTRRGCHSARPQATQPSGGILGRSWAPMGAILGRFAAVRGRLGAVLGPSWAFLGPSWGHLGAILGPPGALLGPSWALLEPPWRYEGESRKSLKNYCFFS